MSDRQAKPEDYLNPDGGLTLTPDEVAWIRELRLTMQDGAFRLKLSKQQAMSLLAKLYLMGADMDVDTRVLRK